MKISNIFALNFFNLKLSECTIETPNIFVCKIEKLNMVNIVHDVVDTLKKTSLCICTMFPIFKTAFVKTKNNKRNVFLRLWVLADIIGNPFCPLRLAFFRFSDKCVVFARFFRLYLCPIGQDPHKK